MADISNTSPERQAYSESVFRKFKGRFVPKIGNIRKFKSNPYIADSDEATLNQLNEKLLKPYDGEQFFDDEGYIYLCKEVKNVLTGAIEYKYISKEKEIYKKLDYYETQGVLNQLMSAYNNGQVYKVYIDKLNQMMYPNTSLVFPENYASYDIREQGLNENNEAVFIAGDSVNRLFKINMKKIVDTANNTTYRRMTPAKVINEIVNGEFYVVNFYDTDGEIVDTKLFQAVETSVENTAVPSKSVTELKVSVLRNGLPESSSNDMYPILAGEELNKTISFAVSAVYNDGEVNIITNKLNTPNLVVEGLTQDTVNAPVGEQFEVTFTYYPSLNEDNEPINAGISKTITFQIVANINEVLYRIIPVMWVDGDTNFNISNAESLNVSKSYKLKVYTLSSDGLLENKTRAFYDTMQKVEDNRLLDFEAGHEKDCAGKYYDPYKQYMVFTFVNGSHINEFTVFNFKLYNDSVATNYRFVAKFKMNLEENDNIFIAPIQNKTDYGYQDNGPLSTLHETYETKLVSSGVSNKILINNVTIKPDNNTLTINLNEGKDFITRYSRLIAKENRLLEPQTVELYSVKDETYTKLTSSNALNRNTTMTISAINGDSTVRNIISGLKDNDFILAKYVANNITVSFDVYCVRRDVYQ